MIPVIPNQRQHKATAKKRFNDLINYLQGEVQKVKEALQQDMFQEGQEAVEHAAALPEARAGLPNDFSELLDYATAPVDTKIEGEKCIAIRTHGVISIETASAEMNAVSRKNTRCHDPVYHFILSWPEHEKPEPAAIFDAAEHAIKSLGFEQHQYVIAVHANTDNIHCHVAMNRVHPTTFKSRHIEWAKRTLHFAARESEIKHGWTHDKGIYVVEVDGHGKKHIVLNAKSAEAAKEQDAHVHPEIDREEILPAWHDPESMDSWLKKSVAKALREELPYLSSWQSLHVWLEQFDIALQDTGGGGLRLRAVSQETGEVLEIAASKGLRQLKRVELEKQWGPFRAPVSMPLVVPDFQGLPQHRVQQGMDYVLGLAPDEGVPPPDHVLGLGPYPDEIDFDDEGVNDDDRSFRNDDRADTADVPGAATGPENTTGDVPRKRRGVHGLSDGNLASGGGQEPSVLLPGAVQDDLGDGQAGQNRDLRRAVVRSSEGARGGRGRVRLEEFVNGRRVRDPALRAQRKAEREAARDDLKQRFQKYRNFVAEGDSDFYVRMKALREERTRQNKAVMADAKLAKAAIPKELDRAVRLVSIIAIDAEVTRRKLVNEGEFQRRREALLLTRVPPLPWREWLYEQSNRGDKAALSALRGIVYQAQRDARLPSDKDEELEDLEIAAADYQELQHKRLMARLLAEERKERAIRASSVHMMRPHEVDALILAYAGIQWRVTGNGNVEYGRNDGQHLFTDRGNRVTFDRMHVTDEEIKLALIHSREKFGHQLTLTGEEPVFVERMARIADDMGLKVLNPELQPALQAHHETKKIVAVEQAMLEAQRVPKPAQLSPQGRELATEASESSQPTVKQGEVQVPTATPTGTESDVLHELQPAEPIVPMQGQEQLRAMVLAIDPRGTFEVADPSDEARRYMGPVASVLDSAKPMFAQHIGRSRYIIHQQAVPEVHDNQVIEVRYAAGSAMVKLSTKDKGPSR